MSESFSPYPVLNSNHCVEIGYVTEMPGFRYTENFEEYPLQLDVSGGNTVNFSGKLTDPRCAWYPSTHDLIFSKVCRITSAYSLFGKNGIAPANAVLGLAVRWISSKSDERGVIPFGEIIRTDSVATYSAEYRFNKGILKGSLKLQTVLYLKDPGTPAASEMYFALQPGTILGTLDQSEVFIDGNGSVFPISIVNAPGKSLWNVYYDETADPLQDPFNGEYVEIRLNKAHPDFDALKIETSMTESTLFLEVVSSAMFVIVEAAKDSLGEDWNNVLNGIGYDPGSIAEAINFFVTHLQWDVSTPAKLAGSIKKFFETKK